MYSVKGGGGSVKLTVHHMPRIFRYKACEIGDQRRQRKNFTIQRMPNVDMFVVKSMRA
jgi:hypothetical protein